MAGAAHGGRPSLFLTHMAADRTQDVADAATLTNAPKPFAKSAYPSLARVQVLHCRAQKLRQGAPFAGFGETGSGSGDVLHYARRRGERSNRIPPGTATRTGTPEWIKIDTRNVTPQLLRQTFDLSPPRGRFRELCAESDQGTVEIARTVIKFAGADPMIDSSLSTLKPRGTTHMVRFGDAERTVETLTLITTTGGRRHHFGRLILSGLHVPDVIIPPLPKRTVSEPVHSAAR